MDLLNFRDSKIIFRMSLLIIAAFVSASNIYSHPKFITNPNNNRNTTSVTTPINNNSSSSFIPIITSPNRSTSTTTSDKRVEKSNSSISTNNLLFSQDKIKVLRLSGMPYGDYISRWIVTFNPLTKAKTYLPIYNPIKITHQEIRVSNTNQGVKVWKAEYQGPIRLTNTGGSERFHNFYLTNLGVEFSISDRTITQYDGKSYYMIIFDGQVQLAELAK